MPWLPWLLCNDRDSFIAARAVVARATRRRRHREGETLLESKDATQRLVAYRACVGRIMMLAMAAENGL